MTTPDAGGLAGWRPIWMATHKNGAKDGRWILAAAGDDPENRFIVKWRVYPPGSVVEGGWQIKQLPGRDPIQYLTATHWQPLPDPPTAPARAGEEGQ
jgi:hypothetical protein